MTILAPMDFDFGGVKRKLTERWLITRTKFTDKAVKYGECNHLKMIGWNYPFHENLHDLVEKYELVSHHFSYFHRIKKKRKIWSTKGAITCSDILKQPIILQSVGISEILAKKVLEEAEVVGKLAK